MQNLTCQVDRTHRKTSCSFASDWSPKLKTLCSQIAQSHTHTHAHTHSRTHAHTRTCRHSSTIQVKERALVRVFVAKICSMRQGPLIHTRNTFSEETPTQDFSVHVRCHIVHGHKKWTGELSLREAERELVMNSVEEDESCCWLFHQRSWIFNHHQQ